LIASLKNLLHKEDKSQWGNPWWLLRGIAQNQQRFANGGETPCWEEFLCSL
jgi:hypothetical protein